MNEKIKPLILIIDDEPDICELLKISFNRMGAEVIVGDNFSEFKKLMEQNLVDFVLTDMHLGSDNGLQIVDFLAKNHPAIPCAVITAYGDMPTAVNALKKGAFDFVAKPIETTVLRQLFDSGLKLSKTHDWGKINSQILIGDSDKIAKLRNLVEKASDKDEPVLIFGPSGSGKNLLAKLLYRKSKRSTKHLIIVDFSVVNVTEHSKKLLEAIRNANGSTLLLKHIDLLPTDAQAMLTELLKTGVFLIDEALFKLDIRLICTSNTNLFELVEKRKFIKELYYHINIISMNTPSLNSIIEDLPKLIDYYLEQLIQFSQAKKPILTAEAEQALKSYSYSGNVRELETILRRALALCENNIIKKENLQLEQDANIPLVSLTGEWSNSSLPEQLEDLEKQRIMTALENNHGNKTAAAKELGISFRALRYRLEKLIIK